MLCQSGKFTRFFPALYKLNVVQTASSAGASASEWAASVSHVVGGKAGGKAPMAIGNGTETGKVDEAIAAATEYLAKLKL
jgi:alanyl-tRNA synthetase